MDYLNQFNKYLYKGTIDSLSLIKLLPKSDFDSTIFEYLRLCGESTDFELDRNNSVIIFTCQAEDGNLYHLDVKFNDNDIFGNSAGQILDAALKKGVPTSDEKKEAL